MPIIAEIINDNTFVILCKVNQKDTIIQIKQYVIQYKMDKSVKKSDGGVTPGKSDTTNQAQKGRQNTDGVPSPGKAKFR